MTYTKALDARNPHCGGVVVMSEQMEVTLHRVVQSQTCSTEQIRKLRTKRSRKKYNSGVKRQKS
jgi:hypothetical protein